MRSTPFARLARPVLDRRQSLQAGMGPPRFTPSCRAFTLFTSPLPPLPFARSLNQF